MIEFIAQTADEYAAKMAELSTDGRCWVGTACFGKAWAKAYRYPSQISGSAFGDSPLGQRGYWKDGMLHSFPQSVVAKYEATGMAPC